MCIRDRHFSRAPTKGLAYTKRALQASLGNDLATQLDLERDMMRELGQMCIRDR